MSRIEEQDQAYLRDLSCAVKTWMCGRIEDARRWGSVQFDREIGSNYSNIIKIVRTTWW
jgi:hypothetical protein